MSSRIGQKGYPNNEASKAPKLSGVFGGRSRPAQWAKNGNIVLLYYYTNFVNKHSSLCRLQQ